MNGDFRELSAMRFSLSSIGSSIARVAFSPRPFGYDFAFPSLDRGAPFVPVFLCSDTPPLRCLSPLSRSVMNYLSPLFDRGTTFVSAFLRSDTPPLRYRFPLSRSVMTSLSTLFNRGAPFVPVLSPFGHAAVAVFFPALPIGYDFTFPSLRSGRAVRSRPFSVRTRRRCGVFPHSPVRL